MQMFICFCCLLILEYAKHYYTSEKLIYQQNILTSYTGYSYARITLI